MSTDTRRVIEHQAQRPDDDDDLAHVSCCFDIDIGLCGSPLYTTTEADVDCIVCLDLERDDTFCPRGLICPA